MGYSHVHRNFVKPSRLETFSKNVFIVLNIIFVVFGFILFVYGCGGKTSTNRGSYTTITEDGRDLFKFTSNILIGIGLVLAAVGLWGMCGLHSYCKAYIYMTLLMLLAFVDITLGIYSSALQSTAKIDVEHNLIKSIKLLKENHQSTDASIVAVRDSWDALQTELRCCGIFNYRDWYLPSAHENWNMKNRSGANYNASNNGNHYGETSEDLMMIPHSCFKNGDDGMMDADFTNPVDPEVILENVYADGCLEKSVLDLDIDRMQRVGVVMAVSKFLAVICAVIVTCYMKNDKEAMYV